MLHNVKVNRVDNTYSFFNINSSLTGDDHITILFEFNEAVLLLADSRHNWQLSRVALIPPKSFSPIVARDGAALFLVIAANLPNVGGSVAVAHWAIGRTLHKR